MGMQDLRVLIIFLVVARIQSAILENPQIESKDLSAKSNHEITTHNEFRGLEDIRDRQQRFFSSVKLNNIDSANELDSLPGALEKADEDPNIALSGVYSDCLVNLSFPCLQRKILVFLDRLGRMAKFNLIGNFLSVVRSVKDTRPLLTEDTLVARSIDDEHTLRTMIDSSIDQFFDEHVIRVTIPAALGDGGRTASVVDFRVGENFALEEGRMKKKKGGKMKGMKKMMMMGCMMMMGKAAMLGPLILGISSLAAIKALIFSTIALTISKIIILKKLKMKLGNKGGMSGWSPSGGGGGGGGWPSSGSGGGGGGWSSGGGGGGGGGWPSGGDRSLNAHSLVYAGYR